MNNSRTYYDILNVKRDATTEQIIKMNRLMSKKYHADPNSTNPVLQEWSHKMMIELNEAYSVLKDPEKRRIYDSKLNFEDETSSEEEKPFNETKETTRVEIDYKIRPYVLKDFTGFLSTQYGVRSTSTGYEIYKSRNIFGGFQKPAPLDTKFLATIGTSGFLIGDIQFKDTNGRIDQEWKNVWRPGKQKK